jgi:hypothetical protein
MGLPNGSTDDHKDADKRMLGNAPQQLVTAVAFEAFSDRPVNACKPRLPTRKTIWPSCIISKKQNKDPLAVWCRVLGGSPPDVPALAEALQCRVDVMIHVSGEARMVRSEKE